VDAGGPQAHARHRRARRDTGGIGILTRIDHVSIGVPDLEGAIAAYARIGFEIHAIGEHAMAFNENDYIELSVLHDAGGLRSIAVRSDDLAADVTAARARGIDIGDPIDGAARLGARNPLPVVFIEQVMRAAKAGRHPNGVLRLERAYVAVADLAPAAELYARLLGIHPIMERGTVINAHMAVFNLGPAALTLAQPAGPGPAADALARRGPGPFQVLYRTRSMEAAARWMADHGVPPPARGTRNTGEQAMIVPPEHAGGAYIGFVGPA
jgi:catechol 2,3-dioxygenase-like lactoylglutathione lyase family enzyme